MSKRRDWAAVRGIEKEDSVLAIARIQSESKSFMCLCASGKICLFVWNEDRYICRADLKVPMKLSSTSVEQFIITGSKECAIAILIVQIAKRDGPIDRIVAAVAIGESVLVASESRLIADVVNVASEIDSGIGLPPGKLWTLFDDFDKEFGLWQSYDSVILDGKESLMLAHRFTPFAIAKALRLETPQTATRQDVDTALKEWKLGEEDIPWKRIRHRAEQVQKVENMKVRDMFVVNGVGVVIARQYVVSVFRSQTEAERKLVADRCSAFPKAFQVSRGEIAQLLGSHGLCQELGARFKAG
ncbi:hypothetical protein FGB62_155g00 [Gracilaria domingensis]|nr:hypothetical protein FGB62_155g00 [Gracilaria domingensis]